MTTKLNARLATLTVLLAVCNAEYAAIRTQPMLNIQDVRYRIALLQVISELNAELAVI
jgi:hypothetical protein